MRGPGTAREGGSWDPWCTPTWTRTKNPSVNSRMLCQLSYRGTTWDSVPDEPGVLATGFARARLGG